MPNSMRLTCTLLSCAVLLAPVARAQAARLGDTVKVFHPTETEGVLVSQDAITLGVRPLNRADTVMIARHDVASVERRIGTHRLGWTPVLAGIGIGAGIGAIAGYSNGNDRSCDIICFTARDKALIGGTFLGLVGAIVGGLVALVEVPTWVPVPPANVSLRMAPVDGRAGLAMRWQP